MYTSFDGASQLRGGAKSAGWTWPHLVPIQEKETPSSTAGPSKAPSVTDAEAQRDTRPKSSPTTSDPSPQTQDPGHASKTPEQAGEGESETQATHEDRRESGSVSENARPLIIAVTDSSQLGTLLTEDERVPAPQRRTTAPTTAHGEGDVATDSTRQSADENPSSPVADAESNLLALEEAREFKEENAADAPSPSSSHKTADTKSGGREFKLVKLVPRRSVVYIAPGTVEPIQWAVKAQGEVTTPGSEAEVALADLSTSTAPAITTPKPVEPRPTPIIRIEHVSDADINMPFPPTTIPAPSATSLSPNPLVPWTGGLPVGVPDASVGTSGLPVRTAKIKKRKEFVRKARYVALRRSMLVVVLGRQLADVTKPCLKQLAKGAPLPDVPVGQVADQLPQADQVPAAPPLPV